MSNKAKQKSISFLIFSAILLIFYYFNPEARDMGSYSENLNRSKTIENCSPNTNATTTYKVLKVSDGDTIEVLTPDCKIESVRMIGINTPETVDPRRPVQCFGEEASNKAKEILKGSTVTLEFDSKSGSRDKYGRILAYVFLPDGRSFNKLMIEEGYAYEYTSENTEYRYQNEFKEAQRIAEENKRGLWSPDSCNGKL
jgi:micrococcal nuclease